MAGLAALGWRRASLLVYGLLYLVPASDAFGCGNALLLQRTRLSRPRANLTMQRGGDRQDRMGQAPRKSGLSRNVPQEKLNRPRFIDEDDNAYGEVGIAMAKWQRTAGPIYIQLAGVTVFASAFYNYFQLSDSNGLSSNLWTVSILTMFLGFALQRGDKDRQRPY